MMVKITNKPFFSIVVGGFSIGVIIAPILSYFIFYSVWKYFSPVIILVLGDLIFFPILYLTSTRRQYFFFIHENGEFKFKKIIFYKSVPVKEIRKFEIYYPGPTTPEKFNKEDTEFKWWGKRDPSGFQMLFYLRNGQIVKVGRTYIPIAEYIRKHLLTQGVVCVERYLSSLNPEKYIDVIYKPSNGKRDKIEHFQNDFQDSFPPPPRIETEKKY